MTLNDRLEAFLRASYYKLPPGMRRTARRVVFWPADTWETLLGTRPKHVPPKGKVFVGSGDFIQRGQDHLYFLQQHAGLLPQHAVLDIGSGIGRTAVALTGYLDGTARYEGFDVVKDGVDWCTANITRDFPQFRFTHVDLVNDLYNLSGRQADAFRFPYPDGTFDVAYLFSVFTHMGKTEVQHYLREIHRVLKPGGRCLGTYFIYTAAIEARIAEGNGLFAFPVAGDGFRLMDAKVEAANIAFQEDALRAMAADAGLQWQSHHEGYWKDQAFKLDGHEYQDIVVLRKD